MNTVALRWMRFWFEPTEPFNLAVCRILCFAALFALNWSYNITALAAPPESFWFPIPLFDVLSIPKPSAGFLLAVATVWRLSLVTSCIGLFTRASTVVAAVLGLYVFGLPHNYGKIDHHTALEFFVFVILAASRCGDALSVDRLIARARRGKPLPHREPSGEYTWPIRCVWMMFALVFFAAGFAKLRNSGLDWIVTDNFARMIENRTGVLAPLARTVLRVGIVGNVLAAGTILFELCYPLALVSRRARMLVVPGVFLMQVGIFLFMRIPFHEFLICNVFWIPWDTLFSRLRRKWTRLHGQSKANADVALASSD
jgi:hypothetical protein